MPLTRMNATRDFDESLSPFMFVTVIATS
jgi:hypothetical protein